MAFSFFLGGVLGPSGFRMVLGPFVGSCSLVLAARAYVVLMVPLNSSRSGWGLLDFGP